MKLFATTRQALSLFERTPLHPQWFALRQHSRTLAHVGREVSGVVLDIGCGNRTLEQHMRGDAYYVGLDYPRTVSPGYPGNADVYADAHSLPLKNDSIDSAVALVVFERVQDPERVAAAESMRVLKPDGKLFLTVHFLYPIHDAPHDYRRWTQHGLHVLLNRAGFEDVECGPSDSALETASLLYILAMCIATSKAPKLTLQFLLPLTAAVTPCLNCLGWARALPSGKDFMPGGYLVVARKRA